MLEKVRAYLEKLLVNACFFKHFVQCLKLQCEGFAVKCMT